MRWNKQYLDILASKCNFEDEERYMDFLEALNTVANRYSCSLHPLESCSHILALKYRYSMMCLCINTTRISSSRVNVFFRIVLMMDREERSVICTYSTNLSSQNSAFGIATAFSKGRQSTL